MGKATYTVTVTNNSNGVSVDYETDAPMELMIPDVAAQVVKDLVNTVRAYDTENGESGAADGVRTTQDVTGRGYQPHTSCSFSVSYARTVFTRSFTT